jgi:hypothetical protein
VQYKCEVWTDKLIAAVEWLCRNHIQWKDIDLDAIRAEIASCIPIVVDKSQEVESSNANIEQTELFSCYYPDGATTPNKGGFDDPEAFKEFVDEMARKNFDIQFKVNHEKHFVRGSDGDLLVRACLLHG